MARPSSNPGLVPSILDRLIDPDSEGTSWQSGYSPLQMTEAVRRDLEDLFNTHRATENIPDHYVEVLSSILGYGLPDLPSLFVAARSRVQELPPIIAAIVTHYEPRLRDVRVVLASAPQDVGHRVRFHIEASLNLDPSPGVAFETVLELATGQTSIRTSEV